MRRESCFSPRILAGKITLNLAVVMEETDVVAEGTPKSLHAGPVGGEMQAAKLITKIQPGYPAVPKVAGIGRRVNARDYRYEAHCRLRVMNSEADPELAQSAVEAVSTRL